MREYCGSRSGVFARTPRGATRWLFGPPELAPRGAGTRVLPLKRDSRALGKGRGSVACCLRST
eukprot:scaffold174637_cov31-Tisochrysis_lutea.AAC.4